MASSSTPSQPQERRNLGGPRLSSNLASGISNSTSTSSGSSGAAAPPQTPQRQPGSATYSSPASYRAPEEECVIIELGSRHLRAGLAGEACPRATISFAPSVSRRVGDFREWLPGYRPPNAARKSTSDWSKEFELWSLDTRDEDIDLVEDKLDRAIRDAFDRYLLLDTKTRRVALILPAVLPSIYIERVLSLLYRSFEVPAVSLFPSAVMAVTGAGMRSGLVVDIGWHETTVTAVDELRHVDARKSTRAMKLATLHMARLLSRQGKEVTVSDLEEPQSSGLETEHLSVSFEDAEAALIRVGWCQTVADIAESRKRLRPGAGGRQISGSWPADAPAESTAPQGESSGAPTRPKDMNFNTFCLPIESALFANGRSPSSLDDEECQLPQLIYKTLAALPPDVRGACISRIMFCGGGSNIPGLKSRIMTEVADLINEDGFDPVRGKAAEEYRAHLAEISSNRRRVAQHEASRTRYPPNSAGLPAGETPSPIPAGMIMPERHPIDEKLARDAAKQGSAKGVTGILRAVESLGSWAGTSLTVISKIKAVVDVTMEDFSRDGMLGAVTAKVAEISVGRPRAMTVGRDSKGWTLGIWA